MKAPRPWLTLLFGTLATVCYATALVGDVGRGFAPALHDHAGAFSAAGGVFLMVLLWLSYRTRKARDAPHL